MWGKPHKPVAGILIFDGVQVLDFAGPYEVLSQARRDNGETYFDVLTVAARPEVTCAGGLRVVADVSVEGCPPLDVLVVPGGAGAREKLPESQAPLVAFIRERAGAVDVLASVCTGAFLLGRAGLLDGQRATTHSRRLDLFRSEFPATVAVQEKIVDLGGLITAAGVSSGIDLALYLLERWFGPEARRAEALVLEGPWT